ncbi:MAG: NAD(P)-dependent dehydrogenase (short-subunit alcohol dehydrogenase family) [Flavobacteriales bacterium]|jgi:NAD(P)-dependent dehydrogenase (short-subunit alcohol dehydrogenase family)
MNDIEIFSHYTAPKTLLNEKVILVTGAGDGIGKAAALSFAEHGATVILSGRNLSKLEEVYDEIEKNNHPKAAIFPINFESAQTPDYKALADAIETEFGRLDGILHNAAELGPRTPISQYGHEEWNKVLQVNLTAPYLLTQSMLNLLSKSANASVLFTSTSVARRGRAFWGAYAVSKAGLENLCQILDDETDGVNQIRFNSINPGATRTKMRATAYPAEDPSTVTEAKTFMNRYLFLLGDDSKEISGQQFECQ